VLNKHQKYINIHTHKSTLNDTVFEIKNVQFGKENVTNLFCSIGIHPWNVGLFSSFPNEDFKSAAREMVCLLVGEVGLDKLHSYFEKQKDFFKIQAQLAQELKMPIMIHCVKAFDEVYQILTEIRFEFPVVFHAYNGNRQLTEQLMKFNSYFSVGELLMRKTSTIRKSILNIPIERLFLETDAAEHNIESIYNEAATLLGLEIPDLQERVLMNFNKVFEINKPC